MSDQEDLSEGGAPTNATPFLTLYQRRARQEGWLLGAALTFCVVMTVGFLWFVCRMVAAATAAVVPTDTTGDKASTLAPLFDWHWLLLGSALIVPPTIVLLALLARIYEKPPTEEAPTAQAANTLPVVVALQEVVKTLADVAKALSPK